MAEVGSSWVSIVPSARGFGSKLSSQIEPEMAKAGKSLGSRLSSGMGDALMKGAKITGVAVAGIIGTALVKGWGRLTAIENAKAKLTGLGNSAKSVKLIMDNALGSVLGTAFGLDEAATVAAGAVAAGIKPGKDLRRVLGLTADAATIAGVSMGEMGAIFNKVASSNKIQGDVIAQLNDAGIPIVQLLGKTLGKTAGQVVDLAKKGKINFADFAKSMQSGMGGAALKSGSTTEGAFKNMGAAISRFGAGLLAGVFPIAKTVFGGITGWLDDLSAKAAPFAAAFSTALSKFITGFQTGEGAGGKFRDILFGIRDVAIKVGDFITKTAIPAVQSFVKEFQNGTGPGGRFKDLLILIYNDAVKPIADFITGTALPAIKNFVQGFADGTGPGGDFRNILKDVYDKALVPLANFITGTALPALKNIEIWITGTGIPALADFKDWVIKNRDTLKVLAEFIGVVLLPVFANMAAKAVASAATQGGAWLSTQVAGVTSALSQLGSHYIIVGGWVMSTAKALASAATTAVIWAMYQKDAAIAAAKTVVSFVIIAAGWVSTAATAMASAVVMAAAWVVGMGPVAWVIAGVMLLIGAIVLIATKTTWFQTIWEYTTGALGKAWQWLWNSVLAPVIRFLLNGFATITDSFVGILRVMSHVPGFDWARTAADKMSGAADKARDLAKGIKDIPDKKTIDITARFTSVVANATQAAAHNLGAKAAFADGTNFAPGGAALVGERGPEIVYLPRGSQVIPNHAIGSAVGGGIGIDYDRLASAMSRVQIGLDGRNVAASVDQRLAPR